MSDSLADLSFETSLSPSPVPDWAGLALADGGDGTFVPLVLVEAADVVENELVRQAVDEGARVVATGEIRAQGLAFGASAGVKGLGGGTLGACIDFGGDPVGVTAGHVLGAPAHVVGAEVTQPAPSGAGSVTRIGSVRGCNAYSKSRNRADLGLIELDSPAQVVQALVDVPEPDLLGRAVEKTGCTTRTTFGTVTRVASQGVKIRIGRRRYRFDGLFAIESESGRFSDFGDSGSVVRDAGTDDVIGMVIAGSSSGGVGGRALSWAMHSPAINHGFQTVT